MASRPCLESGCRGVATTGSRCPTHTKAYEARRWQQRKSKRYRADGWEQRSKAMRQAHVEQYGWVCPGFRVPPHESHDLVVDHDEGVMCRGCNGRKAALVDRRGQGAKNL